RKLRAVAHIAWAARRRRGAAAAVSGGILRRRRARPPRFWGRERGRPPVERQSVYRAGARWLQSRSWSTSLSLSSSNRGAMLDRVSRGEGGNNEGNTLRGPQEFPTGSGRLDDGEETRGRA